MLNIVLRNLKIIFKKNIIKNDITRLINIKKNILLLFILKVINIGINFLSLPLILSYLDTTKYGIWLTISSIIGWAGLFDLGLSNGLRNSLGKSFAKQDNLDSRKIVSTTFFLLLIIIFPVFLITIFLLPNIHWAIILNSPLILENEIRLLFFWVFIFFCIRFISGLIFTVLIVDHKAALSDLINSFINIFNFLLIFLLIETSKNSLFNIGFYSSLIMTIIPITATIWFFSNEYKFLSPTYKLFDKSKVKEFLNQGFGFFIIQISGLVIFSTDSMIISNLFTPSEVVPYNIAFRLFSVCTLFFGIILTPFWSAFNEAHHNNNQYWIKKMIKKLLFVYTLLFLVVVILLFLSPLIYKLWLGAKIIVPFKLSFYMALFVLVQCFNSIFVTYIFSTGKIKIQIYIAVFAAIINIPLSIFLSKFLELGPGGVIFASTLTGLINLIISPIQFKKLINNNAFGIWNK